MYQSISESSKWNNSTKRFYKEMVDVFIATVLAVSKKYDLLDDFNDKKACISLLLEMGFIREKTDMPYLKAFLKADTYKRLIMCASLVSVKRDIFDPYIYKMNESVRIKMQEEEKKKDKYNVVDLFCGAGGLSLGFIHEGCRVIFANDIDELCIDTYKYNHPEIPDSSIICGDITKIAPNINELIEEDVDLIIGGPPCQGFSTANKHHRVINDPRNGLYKYFIKSVEKLVPKIVVMENVRGMMKVAHQVVEDYESIRPVKSGTEFHYRVSYRLLNSADFSVAQNRERLIYIAIRNDISECMKVSPDEIFKAIESENKGRTIYNLSSALEGVRSLEPPEVMGVGEKDTEESGRKIDVNPYSGQENSYLRLINDNRYIPLVFNHKARYCSPNNHEIYRRMRQGDDGTAPQIADIFPYTSRNDKFKDKYFRLYADRPCRTITAHLRADCHSHIHPTEDRALTPREAARVQSFPDDYLFLGPYLKTYIQIGNAVPPLMARGIAKVVLKLIRR